LVRLVTVYVVEVIPVAIGVELSPPEVVPSYTLYDVAPVEPVHDNATWPLPAIAVSPAGAEGAALAAAGVTTE
jgi:hypothetical protein